jgi:hypothetical protein
MFEVRLPILDSDRNAKAPDNSQRRRLAFRFQVRADHWKRKGESMWARALWNDLYELDNSPFCAYGLNYKDVVLAIAESPSQKPRVLRIERRGGHRTLRFRFPDKVDRPERDRILEKLTGMGTSFEGDDYRFFSLDVPPRAD